MLHDVSPYVPGDQPEGADLIKLNTNENPYPPSPRVLEAIHALGADALRKYPDPGALAFRKKCAERYGYPDENWVVAGNGMDELLALAVRTFTDPGDAILVHEPTYTLYEVLADLHGATIVKVNLDDGFNVTSAFFETPARIAFLPRPAAQTGLSPSKDKLAEWCDRFDGLVVIDEAYADFAGDSCIDFPNRFDNVIVMRTFSKSFSLAGVRLGIAIAHPAIIREFFKTKDPMNVDACSLASGLAAMSDYGHMRDNSNRVKATRARLTSALEALGFSVLPSQANFLLAQWDGSPSAKDIFEALRERSIFLRYFDTPRLRKALRITVGTDSEIDILLTHLESIIKSATA
jgi:histidinol-phosphate aminotransferase